MIDLLPAFFAKFSFSAPDKLWADGTDLWAKGGWAMIPLALTGLLLYFTAAKVRLTLLRKNFRSKQWKKQAHERREAKGKSFKEDKEDARVAKEYLAYRGIEIHEDPSLEEMAAAFDQLRSEELPSIEADLKFVKIAMAAAPLWGLLGTVTGMLATFAALAGGGGDQAIDSIAKGISEALITTQTGLAVALPGYFLYFYLSQQRDRFVAFIAHLESEWTQRQLRKQKRRQEHQEGRAA
ncbi:MAG: MotA/TolQ/ExbB proton channel family protein [Verrucomicrobiota bacterium]